MGYKAKVNFSAGKGLDYLAGAPYSGPQELVAGLVLQGLLEEDKGVNVQPSKLSVEEAINSEDDFSKEPEEKPKKTKKRK